MAAPSQVPVRYPSGVTTDPPFGPLANYGLRNPFFYHEWEDDFDVLNPSYTQTKTGTGAAIAMTTGQGGNLLFTASTVAGDACSIQLPEASFGLAAGKKSFFLCRLALSDVTNAAFNVGLIQTTTTPFTVTDGIYFNKASGSATNLQLVSAVGSVATDLVIPAAAYALAAGVTIDLGWYVDRSQNVYAFVGGQLVGWIPQSGTGAVNSAGVPILPVVGPVAAIQQSVTPVALTAAALNFTLAVESGNTAGPTMTVDFAMAAQER